MILYGYYMIRRMVNSDWKNWTIGFPYYDDIDDPDYIRDRLELFRTNGNGWWWNAPSKQKKEPINKRRRRSNNVKINKDQ